MNSARKKAIAALIIANIIWGAASPVFKIALENIPPFTLAFWRFFFGSAILLTVFGKKAMPLDPFYRYHIGPIFLYGFFGIFLNISLFFWGLRLTYAINASVITASGPLLTLLLAHLILKEPIRNGKITGVILGTLGMITIIFQPLLEHGVDYSVAGNIILFFATLAAVGQTITGRTILPISRPTTITFMSFTIAALSFLPLAMYEYGRNPLLYTTIDWRGYLGIVYGALGSSVAAYSLFDWGLSKIRASDASVFTYIIPVVGTLLSHFLLNERVTYLFLFGSMLIIAGILFAEGVFKKSRSLQS